MPDRNEYAARIERVVRYLVDHLDENLDLDTLARVACFSRYHFHRIYRATRGETAADTVRRLRLHRAALELLDAQYPIERIARRAGYSSQAAFTRAFRSAYGMPPGCYQNQAELDLLAPGSRAIYSIDIVDSPRIPLAALVHRGDYHGIVATFDVLVGLMRSLGTLHPDARFFGIYYDDPVSVAESDLRAEACVSVARDFVEQANLRPLQIAAGRYAKLTHVGSHSELERPYTWLYRTWLPSSGEETSDHPCVEEYLNHPRQHSPSDLRTAIWLPLAQHPGELTTVPGRK
jgi:AraC family transcriptional regulator